MTRRATRTAAGPGRELWPLLLLLVLAVALPTACVLWFMTEAAGNERMAVRQKLTDLYQNQLVGVSQALDRYWDEKASALDRYRDLPAPQRFAAIVTNSIAESVIIREPPTASRGTNESAVVAGLRSNIQARVHAGDESGALRELGRKDIRDARDVEGRLVLPYLQLFFLESATGRVDAVLRELAGAAADYRTPMPSAQRLFLMERLTALDTNLAFPTLRAEELAAEWTATAGSNDLWQIASRDGSAIGLFTRENVVSDAAPILKSVHLAPPGTPPALEAFVVAPAGAHLPGWELRVFLEGENPFAAAAERQVAAYLWTAILVILVIAIVAALVARYLVRQTRLNRLKNDFVATVSHELKTPLASMRVLVDTLLDGRQKDEGQATEYLQLVSRENERLSRLIDNFLTFSRMERNKKAFEFAPLEPADVARAAVGAVRERFEAAGFALAADIAPDLPTIHADRDAIMTVLLNLLDNAYKYSGENKGVTVRARRDGGAVCFEVEDRGIGLSRRDAKKVFDRFYQVDQSLSRRVGGCGLGLSIVKYIVDAHGGTIGVKSQPGHGSVFTVRLPAAEK